MASACRSLHASRPNEYAVKPAPMTSKTTKLGATSLPGSGFHTNNIGVVQIFGKDNRVITIQLSKKTGLTTTQGIKP